MKKIEKEIEWVDVHDEGLMISLGIHLPDYVPADFCKTPKERKLLKKLKHSSTDCGRLYGIPRTSPYPLEDKVIVCLKKNDNYPYTTYSRKIWQEHVPEYVRSFVTKKGKCVVDHYIWNGKTYNPSDVPVNPYECIKIYR